MSADVRPFAPLYVQTVPNTAQTGAIVASATATAAAVSSASTVFPGLASENSFCQIQISNKTSVWVHVCFGQFGVVRAATLTDYPVAPGSVAIVTVDPEVNGATVISDGAPAASAVVLFTRGLGT